MARRDSSRIATRQSGTRSHNPTPVTHRIHTTCHQSNTAFVPDKCAIHNKGGRVGKENVGKGRAAGPENSTFPLGDASVQSFKLI